jgi:orotidine-5'-phosphate decarboxylase
MVNPEILRTSQERTFNNLLEQRQISANSLLCVGLDPDPNKIPLEFGETSIRKTIQTFNKNIINATHDLVCAYKLNSAFYEEHGNEGLDALRWTIEYAKDKYADIPIILDAKRGDVRNTNYSYARMAFDLMGVDAITVSPYLGGEAIQPFLDCKDKGVIILCLTSNPGAKEFQQQIVRHSQLGEVPFYQAVAYQAVHKWNKNMNISLVVGASFPKGLARVRELAGDEVEILTPGLGDQGGRAENLIKGLNSAKRGIIATVSRSIIFARPQLGESYVHTFRRETMRWKDAVNKCR